MNAVMMQFAVALFLGWLALARRAQSEIYANSEIDSVQNLFEFQGGGLAIDALGEVG